jgi:uncharacterized membrane protein YkvA (DUF1232 family)
MEEEYSKDDEVKAKEAKAEEAKAEEIKTGELVDERLDFYKRLRHRIVEWVKSPKGRRNKWAEVLLLAPDLFHLLCKLSLDPEVPVKEKAKLAIAIAYFISPIDLIPEIITGPIGYVDDIALAAWVLNSIINNTDPELVRKHWAGEGDILDIIKKILGLADRLFGSGLWKRLKGKVG